MMLLFTCAGPSDGPTAHRTNRAAATRACRAEAVLAELRVTVARSPRKKAGRAVQRLWTGGGSGFLGRGGPVGVTVIEGFQFVGLLSWHFQVCESHQRRPVGRC